MTKKQLIVVWVILILCFPMVCAGENIIPSSFEYDGMHYKHDESFKEFESVVKADIDGDSKDETIAMFETRDDKDIPQAFAFVYGKDYEFRIPVYDYPGKIEAIDIDHDGKKELFLYSDGGMHYTKLFVYKYEDEKGLHKLFENGSACPVEFEFKDGVPIIKVGRANWATKVTQKDGTKTDWCEADEPLWQVYVWNGKEFIYKAKLSSTPEISEKEESQRFLKKAHELLDKKANNKSKP